MFNLLILLGGEVSVIKAKSCCFNDCVKWLNVDIHLDVYVSILFKLGMMVENHIVHMVQNESCTGCICVLLAVLDFN